MNCWDSKQNLSFKINWSLLLKHVATACRYVDVAILFAYTSTCAFVLSSHADSVLWSRFAVAVIACYASRELSRFALSVEISLVQIVHVLQKSCIHALRCDSSVNFELLLIKHVFFIRIKRHHDRRKQRSISMRVKWLNDIHVRCKRLSDFNASEIRV